MFSTSVQAQSYVDDYTPTTYEDFSNLILKYHVHDLDDPAVLKEYFQANNCDLFEEYYKNDFIWQTILDGFKRDIKYFSKKIPHKFIINASIVVDRYDFTNSAFIIDEKFALDNAGSIRIPFYGQRSTRCADKFRRNFFPDRVKFITERKFALEQIPMKMDDANALLERIKNYKYEGVESNRVLAVRFLITINDVDKFYISRGSYEESEVVHRGTLDEIAFFEDPNMTKLIWKKQFKVFGEDQSQEP